MEPPRGNKPPLYYVSFIYVFEIYVWANTMLPPIDYCDGKTDAGKKRGNKNILRLMLCYMFDVIVGVCNVYYSNKIKHSLVQVLLYLFVVYRASFMPMFCENG